MFVNEPVTRCKSSHGVCITKQYIQNIWSGDAKVRLGLAVNSVRTACMHDDIASLCRSYPVPRTWLQFYPVLGRGCNFIRYLGRGCNGRFSPPVPRTRMRSHPVHRVRMRSHPVPRTKMQWTPSHPVPRTMWIDCLWMG